MMEDKRPFLDRWYVETWLREHGHMYQYELAYKAGITGGTLSSLLSGVRKPHPSTVERLAEAMGVDPAEIVVSPEDVPPEVNHEYQRRQSACRKYWKQKRWEEKHGQKKNY